jgi:hypothetical protein
MLAPLAVLRHVLARPPFDRLTRTIAAKVMPAIEREGRTGAFGTNSVERAPGGAREET